MILLFIIGDTLQVLIEPVIILLIDVFRNQSIDSISVIIDDRTHDRWHAHLNSYYYDGRYLITDIRPSRMHVVWLVLDSLGFAETSFADDGPATTPRLAELAASSGVAFERAYAPGPASPSSHASFLTGRRPSETGMHEAHPSFDGRVPTVADALGDTHRSYLTSVNPFLFTGLDDSFDVAEDLAAQEYLVFDSGTDPRRFDQKTDAEGLARYRSFLSSGGTPLRNIANGIGFKLWRARGNDFIPRSVGGEEETYRYAGALNDRVRTALDGSGPAFVVANYMDVHPPLSASPEAIDRFAAEFTDRLPVGVRAEDTDEYDHGAMTALYRAAVWDLDRAVAPLVEDLVKQGAIVVVTADHGPRFGRGDYLTEERLHVPLVLFAPDELARRVSHTVSLQSLPRTTVELVRGDSGGFGGENLLGADRDHTAVTEYLHRTTGDPGPVSLDMEGSGLRYDRYLRRGDTVIRIEGSDETLAEGNPAVLEELRAEARRIEETRTASTGAFEFDGTATERLEDLGYL